jgi:hypothetical protein
MTSCCATDVAIATRPARAPARSAAKLTRPHEAVCNLLKSIHDLSRAARALEGFKFGEEFDRVQLHRLRDRIDGVARLLGATTDALKPVGVGKDDPLIEIDRRVISLQEAARRIRRIRDALSDESLGLEPAGSEQGEGGLIPLAAPAAAAGASGGAVAAVQTVGAVAAAIGVVVGTIYGVYKISDSLIEKIAAALNETDDDRAREKIFASSPEQIRAMELNELVAMIFAMMDGPTGDDDERAILKILESFPCEGRVRIVDRVGVDDLLYNLDGAEWDRLVSLLAECGIIGIDQLDDDGSRHFINTHGCAQLGQMPLTSVRQLVLNLFSGSCGDDDENAILKLLRCQSRQRLQQLVAMPRMSVDDFDDNVDGGEWDQLEALFRANGIAT